MRYYQLQIGSGVYTLDQNNPGGPRITFNINSFTGADNTRPSVVRIYNVDSIYQPINAYKDQQLILRAGVASCPYINRQGIGYSESDYLFCGKIISSSTIWEDRNTVSVFSIAQAGPLESAETVAQINTSDSVAGQLISILTNYYGQWFKFDATPEAYEVFSNAIQTVPIRPHIETSMAMRFFCLFMNQFGLNMAYHAFDQTFTIYKCDESVIGYPYVINPANIISQPRYESFSEVSITIQLEGSLRVNDNVWIAPEIPIFSALGDFTSVLKAGGQEELRVAVKGLYKIKSIEHIGDSRSNDSQSWCTNLLLVPSSDAFDFEAVLSQFNAMSIGGMLKGITSKFF